MASAVLLGDFILIVHLGGGVAQECMAAMVTISMNFLPGPRDGTRICGGK